MYSIYRIISSFNTEQTLYIGSSKNFKQRRYQHLSDVTNFNSPRYNYPLYKYIRNNNLKDELIFEVLEESPAHSNVMESAEQGYIDSYRPLFNQKRTKNTDKY